MDPILSALRELDVIRELSPGTGSGGGGGDSLGLHWKLTLNHYRPRPRDDGAALAVAGGALFPWHTDLAANGQITAIATLLAPAVLGESKRLVVASPWSQFTSECQRCRHPLRLDK